MCTLTKEERGVRGTHRSNSGEGANLRQCLLYYHEDTFYSVHNRQILTKRGGWGSDTYSPQLKITQSAKRMELEKILLILNNTFKRRPLLYTSYHDRFQSLTNQNSRTHDSVQPASKKSRKTTLHRRDLCRNKQPQSNLLHGERVETRKISTILVYNSRVPTAIKRRSELNGQRVKT